MLNKKTAGVARQHYFFFSRKSWTSRCSLAIFSLTNSQEPAIKRQQEKNNATRKVTDAPLQPQTAGTAIMAYSIMPTEILIKSKANFFARWLFAIFGRNMALLPARFLQSDNDLPDIYATPAYKNVKSSPKFWVKTQVFPASVINCPQAAFMQPSIDLFVEGCEHTPS